MNTDEHGLFDRRLLCESLRISAVSALRFFFGLFVLSSVLHCQAAAPNVLTFQYNNARDGANTNEVLLTPANVNATNFARLFTYTVDGYLYAHPLYVSGVTIPGQGTHNVVFAATENNSAYAFDADSNAGTNGGLLWQTNLGIAEISVNNYGVRYHHNVLNPLIGITGTPVIDLASGTLYVDTFTGVIANTNNGWHVLHALNITNGTEQPYSPVRVTASFPGTGVDSTNGVITFNPSQHMNRPAMTLAGGILYVSYGSYGDTDPYHGWVIGYNATNLVQLTNYTFCTTPNAKTNVFGVNAGEGALWMGGDGLCADASGNLYMETGNGSFSAQTNGGDYGDSFVKLSSSSGLAVLDYFAPSNQNSMAVNDEDLGSGGPILLPDLVGSAAHPHLMVGAGKEGTIYLLDRDNMGHFSTTQNQIVQTAIGVIGGVWGSPAYFNHLIYYQGVGDVLKAFGITNGVMTTTPVTRSTTSFGGVGYTPCISANGTSNAIAWVIQTDASGNNGPAVLHAYNAANLAQELYNSSQNPARDNPGGAVKYAAPVVVNGKVYVRGEYSLAIYGLGIFLPAPVISPNGGIFTNSVTVTLTDATNDATIYYTLDGTAPTTNSLLYTGPFVLTNSAAVHAFAVKAGAFNSPAASASFINSSAIGSGTGLLGKYWTNTSSTAFISPSFTNLPTLVRTDATVNFNWGSTGPDPSIGKTNYVVRWSGSVQPQFSETYTFYTTADDGVRLYVNGQLLIDNWVNQTATARSNTVSLVAQQLYNLQLDYFYNNDSGAQVALSWSSPSTTRTIIPQSQLYPYTNPPPTVVIASPSDGAAYSGTASVSISANADAPYNPISRVAFYANNSWLGTLSNSSYAPLYALTTTGFLPNAGGETANSAQVSASPAASVNLVTTNVQGGGTAGWNLAIWQTNNGSGAGTGPFVGPPTPGNSCTEIFNGTQVGNALNSTSSPNNTRVRNPSGVLVATFPGDSLTLNTNTELREKEGSMSSTMIFPGPAGGGPGLILNGGILNCGEPGTFTIAGSIQVASQSYICNGANGAGGGFPASGDNRQWNIAGQLSGSGTLVVMDCQPTLPQIISGSANTFSGQWIVQCGWLQATGSNSLGTNSITVDPNYIGYLGAMPNATSPNGPALLDVGYDMNSAGKLTLVNGGTMNLHQNCSFSAVSIEGVLLGVGTHPYSELISNFPNSFSTNGSGAITVTGPPAPAGPPGPPSTPTGLASAPGNTTVTLSWNASVGATSYNVKRSTTSGGPYNTVATVNGTIYTDSGLANGTTYYYVVSAVSVDGYILTAVATDASGLSSTSAPVHIIVNSGSGLPYGLTSRASVAPFLNMPDVVPAIFPGTLPSLVSGTGAFTNTPNRSPARGLIPYSPNTPLWSDGAVKNRYMSVPNNGGLITPDEQLGFIPTNSWTFPAGTVFVKNFDLVVNETNASVPLRRLETRLLVRDDNGAVYGATYKWRPDNSDADLLATSLNEDVLITNAVGVRTQTWYYPSPADCLTCHTPAANYVLGVNTRQLNGNFAYPATGQTDNQLRALNRLGLFYPAINEADITNYPKLSSLTNLTASLEQRARSYLDANCAQCHQPGGSGITFDARYDTPLANQNITNYPAAFSLGYDGACVVKPKDVWRSVLLYRVNTFDNGIKMPTLARNLIDSNAVQVLTDWINSLPGTPALAPPSILPNGATFNPSITVGLQSPDPNAALHYTLDGSLPTTSSSLYSAPLHLTNSVSLAAIASEAGFNNSVAARALFTLQPLSFTSAAFTSNGLFRVTLSTIPANTYVLEGSTDLVHWVSLTTNVATSNSFDLYDPSARNFSKRFYRSIQR